MSAAAQRVLERLRRSRGEPCSGEVLSRELGVSRAQVWKHVESLRARGYTIAGAPGDGYVLAGVPDRLYPEEILPGLDTRWMAREIHYLEAPDSTNRVAFERARDGAPHGSAVIAEGQTAGRGRLGRTFFSPAYQNLYTSIVLRPALDIAEAPTLILAAAIAVADAVAETLGEAHEVEIKWPNDVLVGGRKTCGILMEMHAEAARVDFVVLGIGVNLNVARADFPAEFRPHATSLAAECGQPIDRIAFARRLFGTLEAVLDAHAGAGFESLRARFEARFRMSGSRIKVLEVGGPETEGIALGIDHDGALRVRSDDGTTRRVIAGDVTLAKETQEP